MNLRGGTRDGFLLAIKGEQVSSVRAKSLQDEGWVTGGRRQALTVASIQARCTSKESTLQTIVMKALSYKLTVLVFRPITVENDDLHEMLA